MFILNGVQQRFQFSVSNANANIWQSYIKTKMLCNAVAPFKVGIKVREREVYERGEQELKTEVVCNWTRILFIQIII